MRGIDIHSSLRYRFLRNLLLILLTGTGLLSGVIAVNEGVMLNHSLETKGLSFAAYIAKLSQDPLLTEDVIQLDAIVNEATKDEDILYAVIRNAQGVPVTSQHASINYQSPRLKGILEDLPTERKMPEIIAAINGKEPIMEVTAPIVTGADLIGSVVICLSKRGIHRQIALTVFSVIALNAVVAILLAFMLFIASKKAILDPIVKLGHAAARLAKGDLSSRVAIETTGEIRMLVDSFNQMAEDLEKTTVSKEYVANIIKSMNDALVVVSPEGAISSVNEATCRLLGYQDRELVGQSFEMIFSEDPEREETGKNLFSIYLMGIVEKVYRAKDGRRIPVSLSVSVMNDAAGRSLGFICMAQDATERKKAEEVRRGLEERLQRLEKMQALGTMAGGVAHDLNNVLGIVVGYAELLLDKTDPASPTRPHILNIMRGGEKAAAIVQDMLTLARRGVQTGVVVNLNRLVTDCQKSPEFEKLYSFHPQTRMEIYLGEELLNILGSPIHLEKTFFNLVCNAVEAMPNGGTLTITTGNRYLDRPVQGGYEDFQEGDYVTLSVTDTGQGIAAADLPHIFEPFYTKKVMGRSGTGLGLAVVWGTIKDHKGYIDVQSEEGKGSVFTLYFPVTREEIAPESPPAVVSEYMGKGESILVVDDVKEQRELASQILQKLNYHVTTAASGEEAVEVLKTRNVDLLLLDMIMDPGMDGLDTYRQTLALHPQQKAVIVSGFSETDRVRQAQALGAGTYVRKPYVLEKIGVAIRKELDE
ncbi:MAG: PAS domain S-box protein [Deltaproteobacteria bacterium]|nr:PAS domain S-box protein [Deltaproteobacteria bacterium]